MPRTIVPREEAGGTARILTVVGARPQFVKAAVVSRAIQSRAGMEERIIHTGQHYDFEMSDLFFDELSIPAPSMHLGIGSGSHGVQTGQMLAALEQAIDDDRPDWLLVYGDTNSTLAGALAAAKLQIRVAHVEAGLRSFDRRMPEEINRVLTDHVSTLMYTPTNTATNNLRREGISGPSVHQVGDVMYDATLLFAATAARRSGALKRFDLDPDQFVLATIHRAENTDDTKRLAVIVEALLAVAADIPVIFPAHPRTRSALCDVLTRSTPSLRICEPIGYLDMQRLEGAAAVIVTDSGGVQKEAFFHRCPCVTLRNETEWLELVELGWNCVIPPTDSVRIREAVLQAIGSTGIEASPYGDGHASERIASILAAS